MSLDTTINLLTLGELKQYIEGSTTGTTGNDERYNQVINGVSAFINQHCDRTMKLTTYSSSAALEPDYDGNGTAHLFLNNFPVSSTGITINIDSDWKFTTDTVVPSTDYVVYRDDGHIFMKGEIFKSGFQNVRITYAAGYSSDAIPYDVKRAAVELAQFYWNRENKKDRIGVRNESFEGGSRSFETDMPWSVIKLLEHHRSPRYG
jgi:hypothetical protein